MAKVRFGDIVRDVKINVDRDNNPYENYIAGDHMDSEDLTIHRYGSFATDDVGPAFTRIFKPGQILYGSRRTYLKKVAVAEFEGICANTTFVFESKDEAVLDNRLLPFIMLSDAFTRWSIAHSKGSTNPYVLFSDLADYEFELPTIAEQKVLADKLWAAYRLKESYKKLLEATQEMVKSQFIEMRSHTTTTRKKVGEVSKVMTGSTPSRNHPKYWGGSNYWVAAQDMGGKYVTDTLEKVTDEGYATCKVVPAGSVLYVCRGSIGVISINTMDCATNQSICTATCNDGYINEYLYYSLKFAEGDIKKQGTGTSFKSLNQSSFAAIELDFPSIDDQKAFVEIARQADKSESAQKLVRNINYN